MSDNRQIIRDGVVVDDDWTLVPADAELTVAALPKGNLIVPLAMWLAEQDALIRRTNETTQAIGVWLDGADDPALLAASVGNLAVIAVNFPKFADGRGYSTGALLRSRYGFKGELRAIGDVLRDQLFFLQRAGFNAFVVRADKDIDDAVKSLKDFSVTYQGSVDQPLPLFKRRQFKQPLTETAR